jgi:predicted RNA-binding Zn ribbon-like protein
MALEEFILLGDALWLDFVNTARGRTVPPHDRLPDPPAWARWSALQHLDRAGDAVALPETLALRARLTELAEALHDGRVPSSRVIATLNHQLGAGTGRQQLTRVSGDWRLQFAPFRPPDALEAIARSVAITLVDTRVAVRLCGAESCSLFFTDDSPTGSRRWCDSDACGRHARIERRRGALR